MLQLQILVVCFHPFFNFATASSFSSHLFVFYFRYHLARKTMHCQSMLLLTFSSSLLFLLSGPTCAQLSSAAENALENAFEPSRDEGDLQAQRFSASGGALEVSTNQQQPVLRQQPQRPSYTLLQQQPTLELRPFFFSDHFLRQVPPVASFGVNSKYGGDRQRAMLYKPIRELVPVSSSFLSRGNIMTFFCFDISIM